jgi:hypothetical protein
VRVKIGIQMGMIGKGLSCLAALFTILMIAGIRARQQRKLERVG